MLGYGRVRQRLYWSLVEPSVKRDRIPRGARGTYATTKLFERDLGPPPLERSCSFSLYRYGIGMDTAAKDMLVLVYVHTSANSPCTLRAGKTLPVSRTHLGES